jgi:hypothetical protein
MFSKFKALFGRRSLQPQPEQAPSPAQETVPEKTPTPSRAFRVVGTKENFAAGYYIHARNRVASDNPEPFAASGIDDVLANSNKTPPSAILSRGHAEILDSSASGPEGADAHQAMRELMSRFAPTKGRPRTPDEEDLARWKKLSADPVWLGRAWEHMVKSRPGNFHTDYYMARLHDDMKRELVRLTVMDTWRKRRANGDAVIYMDPLAEEERRLETERRHSDEMRVAKDNRIADAKRRLLEEEGASLVDTLVDNGMPPSPTGSDKENLESNNGLRKLSKRASAMLGFFRVADVSTGQQPADKASPKSTNSGKKATAPLAEQSALKKRFSIVNFGKQSNPANVKKQTRKRAISEVSEPEPATAPRLDKGKQPAHEPKRLKRSLDAPVKAPETNRKATKSTKPASAKSKTSTTSAKEPTTKITTGAATTATTATTRRAAKEPPPPPFAPRGRIEIPDGKTAAAVTEYLTHTTALLSPTRLASSSAANKLHIPPDSSNPAGYCTSKLSFCLSSTLSGGKSLLVSLSPPSLSCLRY